MLLKMTLPEMLAARDRHYVSKKMDLDLYFRVLSGERPEPRDTAELLEIQRSIHDLFVRVDAAHPQERLVTLRDVGDYLDWVLLLGRERRKAIDSVHEYWRLLSWHRAKLYLILLMLTLRAILPGRWRVISISRLVELIEYIDTAVEA